MSFVPTSLSILIPAYNEEPCLASTLGKVSAYLDARGGGELIVFDDGSKDGTRAIADEFAASHANVRVLGDVQNHGKGYAVRHGLRAATGDLRAFMDADYSATTEQLDRLLALADEGYDVIVGTRTVPASQIVMRAPWHRHVMGECYIRLSNLLLGTRITDFNCGLKVFTASAAEAIFSRAVCNGWHYDSESLFLATRLGLRIREEPVEWAHHHENTKVHPLTAAITSFAGLVGIRRRAVCGTYRLGTSPSAAGRD